MLSQGEPCDATINFDAYQILQYVDNGMFMYAEHGTFVDADASGAKISTKDLESHLGHSRSCILGSLKS